MLKLVCALKINAIFMKAIGNIHLIWRLGKGSRRISVGTIKKPRKEFAFNIIKKVFKPRS
jgi:hypothetical protein